MKRLIAAVLVVAVLGTALAIDAQQGGAKPLPPAPKSFFGIGPQEGFTPEDLEYMKAGGIGTIRLAISWAAIQPTATGGYVWSAMDPVMEEISKSGLEVLPFLYQTPRWLAPNWRTLPVANARQRQAWTEFLTAIAKRYGPGGEFWAEHSPTGVQYQTAIPEPTPIRSWQIWNEANFHYFASPVSPSRYAKLVSISAPAIKSVNPGAKVILAGLFGRPPAGGNRGMAASDFLAAVYGRPGIKASFDGVALHPYAVDAETLEEMVEEIHDVTLENHDHPGLYLTELGWGSQNDFNQVAFEQGIRGQVKQLRDSYSFLLENRRRLNIKAVYWFSWKDLAGSCNFCDSVGLFRRGAKFKPKPAWHAFVSFTGGSARP
jgi:hypothetical protein